MKYLVFSFSDLSRSISYRCVHAPVCAELNGIYLPRKLRVGQAHTHSTTVIIFPFRRHSVADLDKDKTSLGNQPPWDFHPLHHLLPTINFGRLRHQPLVVPVDLHLRRRQEEALPLLHHKREAFVLLRLPEVLEAFELLHHPEAVEVCNN